MPRPLFRPKLVLAVLAGYAAAVSVVAFWPTPVDRPLSGLLRRALSTFHTLGLPPWVNYAFVEFTANVALFVPIGFLVAALLQRRRTWLAIAAGALLSMAIECAQWLLLPERFPSAGDVLANTLGTTIGAALLALILNSKRT